MIKLAVFDWNGTILSDATAVVEGTNRELAVVGRPPISLNTFRNLYDVPLSIYFKRLGITEQEIAEHASAMAKAFHDFYEPRIARTPTRTGARIALNSLHERNIQRIILSNHMTEAIYTQLQRLKLGHHFEAVLANDEISAVYHLGKEERLRSYMMEQKIDPASALIVGDTQEEIRIGRNLGLKTVAISGGHCSRERLEAAKPDVLISSLHDLIDAIEEL